MIVAAKCNITKAALEQFKNLKWGFHCKLSDEAILENYAEHLACSTVNIPICNHGCEQEPIISTCSDFSITKITGQVNPESNNDLSWLFSVLETDIVGGGDDFSYEWEFDTEVWDLEDGTVNDPILKLRLKEVTTFSTGIYQVKVTLTDNLGCSATKTCYLYNGEMNCDANTCPTVNNLTVEPVIP